MGCERVWSVVHVMWSVVYVACGAAQLVAGIFFILGVPSWILGCNLLTGSYNILMGIGVGMVACCGQVTPRRQETLLYMTVSILMANVANIVVSEFGFYHEKIGKLMDEHQYNELIKYACFGTRATAALVLLVSFLDSQLAFCSMQSAAVARAANKKPPKHMYYQHHRVGGPGGPPVLGSHEQVSDIEYIIPRQKSASKAQHQQQVYNAYSQSWVFDTDSNNTTSTLVNPNNSSGGSGSLPGAKEQHLRYISQQQHQLQQYQKKLPQQNHQQYYDGTSGGDIVRGKQLIKGNLGLDCGLVVTDSRHVRAHLIDNPNPVVLVDEPETSSDTASNSNSASNSDRKLCYMKSFSRSTSPVILSACSSQLSLNQTNPTAIVAPVGPRQGQSGSIYECLEHFARPEAFRKSADVPSKSHHQVVMVRGASIDAAATPQAEKVQYACLMKELQSAIVNKSNKTAPVAASGSTANSKSSSRQESASITSSKNSDAEFSKELEAALQLIQDLESPNTIGTPSEHNNNNEVEPWRINSRSDSEKTLSATGSLAELSPIVADTTYQTSPQLPPPQPIRNGKGTRIFVPNSTHHQTSTTINSLTHSGGSQSTSGYSSPTRNKSSTHTPVWSTTSSMNGSSQDVANSSTPTTLTYTIHNTKSTAVISLYAQDPTTKPKSITLVTISGDTNPADTMHDQHQTNSSIYIIGADNTEREEDNSTEPVGKSVDSNSTYAPKHARTDSSVSSERRSSVSNSSSNIWSVKSLLRKKRSTPPKLCAELEGAIVKSESLAYLSELELVARHERNTSIQRQIEQKVHQQLSTPRTSSNC